jgi:uncharacterized membrane protein
MKKIIESALGYIDFLILAIFLIVGYFYPNLILALLSLFFIPGYFLVYMIIPDQESLKYIPRIFMSTGVSFVMSGIIALAHSYFFSQLIDIVQVLFSITFLLGIIAFIRRKSFPSGFSPLNINVPKQEWWKNIKVFFAILFLGVVIYFSVSALQEDMGFSEFYILGTTGKASKYPSDVKGSSPLDISFGVVNHEGQDISFIVVALLDDNPIGITDFFIVPNNESYEGVLTVILPEPGLNQKVEILLGCKDCDFPYRELTLWLNSIIE